MSLDTTENKITIVLSPMGMIIGRMAEGIVTFPRHLVVRKEDQQSINIDFKEIFGNPELFFIGNAPYYFSENSELNELFVETITGIRVFHPEVVS